MTLAQLEELMKTFFSDDVEVVREAPDKLELTINGRTLHITEELGVHMDEWDEARPPQQDIQAGDVITDGGPPVCGCCEAPFVRDVHATGGMAIIVADHDSSITVVVCHNCAQALKLHIVYLDHDEVSRADFETVSVARKEKRADDPRPSTTPRPMEKRVGYNPPPPGPRPRWTGGKPPAPPTTPTHPHVCPGHDHGSSRV